MINMIKPKQLAQPTGSFKRQNFFLYNCDWCLYIWGWLSARFSQMWSISFRQFSGTLFIQMWSAFIYSRAIYTNVVDFYTIEWSFIHIRNFIHLRVQQCWTILLNILILPNFGLFIESLVLGLNLWPLSWCWLELHNLWIVQECYKTLRWISNINI